MKIETKALLIHWITASGAVFAMLALLAAVEHRWDMMYLWLIVAFIVDGIDGPLARRYRIKENAPQYDGVLLDLIIDYLTYVFIPAFALFVSGLLPGWTGWFAIIFITYGSAMYFADTRMKTHDSSFSGFPGCWNMVVLVMFALRPDFWIILLLVVLLTAAMFIPLKFIHPVRTRRWRKLSLPVAMIWTVTALWASLSNFDAPLAVNTILTLSSLYLGLAGIAQQVFPAVERRAP